MRLEPAVRAYVAHVEEDHLAELINMARNFPGLTAAEADRVPVALKAGERVYAIVTGVALVEPRSSGGRWQGGSRGVSVKMPGTKSKHYRIGATQGRYVRAEEKPTAIDEGTVVITDKRVAFAAPNRPASGRGPSA